MRALSTGLLARPRLLSRVEDAFRRRLTLVIADAGFGKSSLLQSAVGARSAAWVTLDVADSRPGRLAARVLEAFRAAGIDPGSDRSGPPRTDEPGANEVVAGWLAERIHSAPPDLVLVLDDVHFLEKDSAGALLVEALLRQAPVHLAVASRDELPFRVQRLRGRGEVTELDATDLAFDQAEVAALLEQELADADGRLALTLHTATGGWPAALRLAVETLRTIPPQDRLAAAESVGAAPGPVVDYLAEEVLARLGAGERDALSMLATVHWFSAAMARALGIPEPLPTVASLERRGLIVRQGPDRFALHALIRPAVQQRLPLSRARRRRAIRRAVTWLDGDGAYGTAVQLALDARDPEAAAAVLRRSGEALVAAGETELVIGAHAGVPANARDAELEIVVGDAHASRGNSEAALDAYDRARERLAASSRAYPAHLAWRVGAVEFERGRFEAARRVLADADLRGADSSDVAFVLSGLASVQWNEREPELARSSALAALAALGGSGEPRALAAAHMVLGMTGIGQSLESRTEHLRIALAAAQDAGDRGQEIRIRANLATIIGPAEGLRVTSPALAMAELLGSPIRIGRVLNNRGENLFGLGRYEEAAVDFRRSAEILNAAASPRVAWAWMNHGDVARERGDLGLARTLYEQAHRAAQGDTQGQIGSDAGLARILATTDLVAARNLAERAVGAARPLGIHVARSLLALGWVAVADGRLDDAAAAAEEAERAASEQGWPPDAAEAAELHAAGATEEADRRMWLETADARWAALEHEPARARVAVALAWLSGEARQVRAAARRLRASGVGDRAAGAAGLLATLPSVDRPAHEVRTLGGFAVLRAGAPIDPGSWGSRKARDLLKILISRRGRPIGRGELAGLLWPDEEAANLDARLSVAASLMRKALNPERTTKSVVAADRERLWLDREAISIDVEDFLDEASRGLAAGDTQAGERHLEAAQSLYSGEFLEEDPYADWAVGLREEARAASIAVARRLADRASARGDHDAAARQLLRVLERDAFDESAHLTLVGELAAGRHHGEARRMYRGYVARMAEIGVEPAVYPSTAVERELKAIP